MSTMILKNDGTVWTWRTGTPGQINIRNVIAIATGDSHTVALKDDGTVWAWGNNSYGQLGDGTTTRRLMAYKYRVLIM